MFQTETFGPFALTLHHSGYAPVLKLGSITIYVPKSMSRQSMNRYIKCTVKVSCKKVTLPKVKKILNY